MNPLLALANITASLGGTPDVIGAKADIRPSAPAACAPTRPCYTSRMLLLALLLTLLPAVALADVTGPAHVIDGDTIEVAGERIRLHGVAAPEMDAPGG